MIVNPLKITTTTATGAASGTFNSTGLCHQIVIKPATSSTQFDFTITSQNGIDIYQLVSEIGTQNSISLIIPFSGTMSWEIENATADEEFKIYMGVRNL